MITVNAYAALADKESLQPYQYDLPELGPDQVDIRVSYCGLCHSDLEQTL